MIENKNINKRLTNNNMKKIVITLSMLLLITTLSLFGQSQLKTTIPNEIHLLQNPYRPMNILLIPANIEGITAQKGDLVMAFDGETCVGAAIIKDVNEVLNLVATSTDEVNKGYRSGQKIRLEYHSTYDNTVNELTPEKILLGSMTFEEMGTFYAKFKATVLGINENVEPEITVYPNPVSQKLHIVLEAYQFTPGEKLNLKIVDVLGKVVIDNDIAGNPSVINLDMARLLSGQYTLVLTGLKLKFTLKVIKK